MIRSPLEGWIAVCPSKDIKQRKPTLVRIRDARYTAYRVGDQIKVFPDTCRHRGMSLSMGKVLSEGCIECPYHGYKHNEVGHTTPYDNTLVPYDPSQTMNYKEQDGLLWLQPAHLSGQLLPFHVPFATDPGVGLCEFDTVINCHPQLILENALDPAHASWVHANPLGFGTYRELPTNVSHTTTSVAYNYVPNRDALSSRMFDVLATHNIHHFVLPYTTYVTVDIRVGGEVKTLMTWVTLCPLPGNKTRMFVKICQNLGLPGWMLTAMGRAIVDQDRQVLENLSENSKDHILPGLHDELILNYRKALGLLNFK